MKREKNTAQMKEHTRNTEVKINEEEIGKLPEKEFRIMIVKVTKNLENKIEKMQESINKDLEESKNKHIETNSTITEIKNILEGINRASLVAQMLKRLPTMWETWDQSLGWEDLLEKGMATHSSILAWKIPWMVEPGRLQSMGSQRVRYD